MKKYLSIFLSFTMVILSCSCGSKDDNINVIVEYQKDPNYPIRAVWIPDPSHTPCMTTYQNVLNTVSLLDEVGINTVYLCAWARTQTIFKSQVLKDNSSYQNVDDGYLFKNYMASYNTPKASPTGDPVKDLIVEAGKKNIKVIFWFEYGFMASNGVTPASNPLLVSHPEWMSKNSGGTQANYNSTDYYFNGYHAGLQEFMLKLVEESMTLYPDIAGIQGDDRMPAMPRNSGYDDYTVELYKSQHSGAIPPTEYNNETWVRWRLDILNNFAKTFYSRIKAKNIDALVCFSPNPYPWCKDNLMQEWPQWIASVSIDLLSVQCYRNDISSYTSTIQSVRGYIKEKTNKNIFNPGMILKNGSTIMSKDLLEQQLKANRDINTNGEAFFYIDGLNNADVKEVLKRYYK